MRIYLLILLSLACMYGQVGGCMDNGYCTGTTCGFDSLLPGHPACNYDETANVDDGSCRWEDCEGECTCLNPNYPLTCSVQADCNGACDGPLLDGNSGNITVDGLGNDECDVCDGSGPNISCWDGSLVCNADVCPFNPDDCEDGTTGCACDVEDVLENEDIYSQAYIEFCINGAGSNGCYGSLYTNNDTCVPENFSSVNKSTKQTLYGILLVTINGEPIDADDWVGAFNGDVCVGARKWDTSLCNNGVCDVPAQGDDGNEGTEGYMLTNYIPTFQIYDMSENTFHSARVSSENIAWAAFGVITISSLIVIDGCTDEEACNYNSDATEDNDSCLEYDCADECGGSAVIVDGQCSDAMAIDELLIPNNYSISSIYPNPFNPITNIEYSLPENADIELIIYNIHGRHIQTLVQSFQTAGYHSINWNAQNYPSGVYLIRLKSSTYSKTQKVVLYK